MSQFFINRPVFAWVLAIGAMLSGLLSISSMAVSRYPTIPPPTVSVSTTYTGASAVVEYEYTIQTAFQEVSDALATQRNMDELLAARESLLAANEKIYRLTEASYRKGLESSLSVLTVQRSYYDAQQNMIAARLEEASNWVSLYRVLGGGWQS